MNLDWLSKGPLVGIVQLGILFSAAIGAVWYLVNKKKTESIEKIDSQTIIAYKNALESTRTDLQTQLDHCSNQHKESQQTGVMLQNQISELSGQIKILKEIPLTKLADGIDALRMISESNEVNTKQILNTLKSSAVILKEAEAKNERNKKG